MRLFLPLAAALLLPACTSQDVRIRNASPDDFTDVFVGDVGYGDVASGTTTSYAHVDTALGYVDISLQVDGAGATGQTLTPGGGALTYEISWVDTDINQLGIEIIED